jgi:CPA2 family monovalent cation:H+ antiporter-2
MVHVLLTELVVVMAVAVAVAFLLRRLAVPPVVGFVIAGVVIGPYGVGVLSDSHQIEVLAEVGVVLLLFAVGLKLPLRDMWRLRLPTFGGGGAQVLTTWLLTAGVAIALGRPTSEAIVWGALVALSSTALVLWLLESGGDTQSTEGRTMVSVLLFQDLAVIPIILSLPVLAGTGGSLAEIIEFVVRSVAIVVLAVVGARVFFPRLTSWVVRSGSRELFTLTTVLVAVGTAALFGQFGLSMALGAFLAGMVISESEYVAQMVADITPLRDVFNSVFFVSMGMLFDPGLWLRHPLVTTGMLAAVVVGKSVIAGGVARLVLGQRASAFVVGFGLAQIGEFSVIVAHESQRLGILGHDAHALFLAVAVPSMVLTPFALRLGRNFKDKIGDQLRPEPDLAQPKSGLSDHVVIVGYGINGRNVAHVLRRLTVPFAVIDLNPLTVKEVSECGGISVYGDARHEAVQRAAGVHQARCVVAAVADATSTREIVVTARRINPRATILARTRYLLEVEPLTKLGADEAIPEEFETSIELAGRVLCHYGASPRLVEQEKADLRARHYGVLRGAEPDGTGRSLDDLREHLAIQEITIGPESRALGADLRQLAVRAQTGATVLAIRRGEEWIVNPKPDLTLLSGDELVVLAAAEEQPQLEALFTPRDES